MATEPDTADPLDAVLKAADSDTQAIDRLLTRYQLRFSRVADSDAIPGSFWGDSEAGLVGENLYWRGDTPVHSILHEACHFICMDESRRTQLHTNAGGDYDEENAVCYLQILLAEQIPGFGRDRALEDMDRWGYSFRLGSARRWFEEDAEDAENSLRSWGLIDDAGQPRLGRLRDRC
jgi:hypothetical protein